MGKETKPDYPAPPEYQEDPRVSQGIDQLFSEGTKSVNLDFTGKMAETIETSPKMTELYLKGLRAQLEPYFNDQRQETINALAAQGQLSGSTLPSELGKIERNQQNQYITQASEFGINDINRAMNNRMTLHGRGLDAINAATQSAGNEQARSNDFALNNYGNQVAYADMIYEPSTFEKAVGNVDPLGSYLGWYGSKPKQNNALGSAINIVKTILSLKSGGLIGGGADANTSNTSTGGIR